MTDRKKEMKKLDVQINFFNMQKKMEKFQNLIGKHINQLQEIQENPEKFTNLSSSDISNLSKKILQDLKNYNKYAHAFFVSYKKVYDLLFVENESQSKNK